MPASDSSAVPLGPLIGLFFGLLIGGILLTLPLYKWNIKALVKSRLFIKIIFWLPIFLVFIVCLYLQTAGRLAVMLILDILAWREARKVAIKSGQPLLVYAYFAVFCLAFIHFPLLGAVSPAKVTGLLITIGIASVLSDVFAFFMGNYFGKHKLPAAFNSQKSWEGVDGQIIGALIGVILVKIFVLPEVPLLLFLPIGIGSAAGDLANSYVKRRLGIKEWGNGIPGHGGYIDRLSSLAGSFMLAYYFAPFLVN